MVLNQAPFYFVKKKKKFHEMEHRKKIEKVETRIRFFY